MPILSAGQNRPIPSLHDSCTTSARPYLVRLEPSRWLRRWWIALHTLVAAALVTAGLEAPVTAIVLLLLALHYRLRRPRQTGLLLLGPGSRAALPLDERFGLNLTPRCREGPWWVELAFDDGGPRLLVMKDQLAPGDWRRLRLAIREPGLRPFATIP